MVQPLSCRCGGVQGTVATTGPTTRAVCYCADCQAYARFLGRAEEILDDRGGSEVVMTVAGNVAFRQGRERLACVRLTPRGPLRWYAACCNTPIGNTAPSHKVAFVGLLAACLGSVEAFGPIAMWNFTAGAKGEPKPRQTPIGRLVWRVVVMTLRARLDGSYRRTPFFDAQTGHPLTDPLRLSARQRAEL